MSDESSFWQFVELHPRHEREWFMRGWNSACYELLRLVDLTAQERADIGQLAAQVSDKVLK